jgi:hypothetical protein
LIVSLLIAEFGQVVGVVFHWMVDIIIKEKAFMSEFP